MSHNTDLMEENKAAGRRVALVTGASQGLGAEIAVALARDGCDVAVSSRRVEKLADTLERVAATGARAVPVELDLRSQPGIEMAMAQAVGAFGHVDTLVNNAAVTLRRPVLEVTLQEWDLVMAVNLTGTFFMSQQMGRHLIAARAAGCSEKYSARDGVSTVPGAIALTRMPCSAHSTASIRVIWMIPALEIPYAERCA